jgi:hypothetical protein
LKQSVLFMGLRHFDKKKLLHRSQHRAAHGDGSGVNFTLDNVTKNLNGSLATFNGAGAVDWIPGQNDIIGMHPPRAGHGQCSKGVRHILAHAGLNMGGAGEYPTSGTDADHAWSARHYLPYLEKRGWASAADGPTGTSFNENTLKELRAKMEKDGLGDRPIVVVMTPKHNIHEAGHIFYIDHNDSTFSDFCQSAYTGQKGTTGCMPDHAAGMEWHALVYTGPVDNSYAHTPEIVAKPMDIRPKASRDGLAHREGHHHRHGGHGSGGANWHDRRHRRWPPAQHQ